VPCRTWVLRTWYREGHVRRASRMTHTEAVTQRRELGEFLASRRAKLRPEQAGISAGSRRRVAGLRRQEIAEIAGVSVDYYVRLEQGRAGNVSQAVLDAIARALQLDDDERSHLWALAHPASSRRPPERAQRVRPQLLRILDSLDLPAVVIGRRMDILAWKRLGADLYGVDFDALPQELRNWPRLVFLRHVDPRALYPDWDRSDGPAIVGYLRLDAGRHPDDPAMTALVEELSRHSPEFRRWWAAHDVRDESSGRKRINHPVAGELDLTFETLRPADDPDQALFVHTADPGSPTTDALRLLANWATGPTPAGIWDPAPIQP
jgi:transcriptional regulator with XRE-family HTH domain